MISKQKLSGKVSLGTYYSLFVVIVLCSLLAITAFYNRTFYNFFAEHLAEDLEDRARIIVSGYHGDISAGDPKSSDLCRKSIASSNMRITVIDNRGAVVCDSDADWQKTENHALRPEVHAALSGKVSSSTRYSSTLEQSLLYVALPIQFNGNITGVVRTALPLTAVSDHLQLTMQNLILVGLGITLLISLLSCYLYKLISPSLREIEEGSKRFAHGDFEQSLPQYNIREIDNLASTMNKMGCQLQHLEEVRRDFVANVSHELKTPITSIKGFVETLLDGASANPEDLQRFLEIISKQSDRLTTIIEDLLTLARLEGEKREDLLVLEQEQALNLLSYTASLCQAFADEKRISLLIDCPEDFILFVDRSLLEQALANLVDNAIKYSGKSSKITLSASVRNYQFTFQVRDEGPGIDQHHLPRLFERFYRVDKARCRGLGGTGLGLAIVKHIVAIHRGTITVDSKLGSGSTFTISLPGAESQ